jgi:hypothetical protein
MKGRDTVVRIDRAYSQQEKIWAKLQNLTERPTIHRSAYERVDLAPNRNEGQIRPVSKNRSDRWIVCSYSQADAFRKRTGYCQIGRTSVDKNKLPRLNDRSHLLSECKLAVN